MTPEEKLAQLGITLPPVPAPAANYVPWKMEISALVPLKMLYVSGQLPTVDGKLVSTGIVGRDVTPEDAKAAARVCAINILACAKAAAGELSKVEVVRIEGFVASTPDFTSQPAVINGASDFLVEVLGPKGRHARIAVGVASLPLNAPVEISAILRVM